MEFVVLTKNSLDEDIDVWKLIAKDEEEAWELIEEASHPYDTSLLLSIENFRKIQEFKV